MHRKPAASEVYSSCMKELDDAQYCSGLVDAYLQATSSRLFGYIPKGRTRPWYMLLLNDIEYDPIVMVDYQEKRTVFVVLRGPNHSIGLLYERGSDGRFVLRVTTFSNLELTAILNGPLDPTVGGRP
jgi:hypothetical protein